MRRVLAAAAEEEVEMAKVYMSMTQKKKGEEVAAVVEEEVVGLMDHLPRHHFPILVLKATLEIQHLYLVINLPTRNLIHSLDGLIQNFSLVYSFLKT